jgi:hypothetical protein
VLDLSCSPVLYPFADRMGPGYADTFMPGTFLSDDEEEAYLERLKAHPPPVAVLPLRPFDGIEDRAVERVFPRISAWVSQHYEPVEATGERLVLALRPSGEAALGAPRQGRAGLPAPPQ